VYWTILHSLARTVEHPELVPVVFGCPKLEFESASTRGWTALHFAAEVGNLAFIEAMDFEKCEINPVDEDDVTPLHLAARGGHWQVVKFMIGIPAVDIMFQNRVGGTAMHESICGNLETVQVLLDCPAVLPNAKEGSGLTALHCAVIKQKLEIVRLLVGSERIDVNCRDERGRTPLHLAVRGSPEIVACLTSCYRIDVNQRDGKNVCLELRGPPCLEQQNQTGRKS
jgi:ankyrin repeat protein